MTPPEFSVLLLAWDDADPTVAVLGGAALPPTLPLVYQLAARQPVLAVYPHLPAGKASLKHAASNAPKATTAAADSAHYPIHKQNFTDNPTAVSAAPEAAVDALEAVANRPGIQLLPTAAAQNKTTTPARQSRIIGLTDLAAADAPEATAPAIPGTPAKPLAPSRRMLPAAPGRSQWPVGAHAPALAGQWQAPAAPYLGAGSGAFFPPPPPAPPRPLVAAQGTGGAVPKAAVPGFGPLNGAAAAVAAISMARATIRPRLHPQAGDLNFDPDPELPAVQHPAVFEETTAEIGAAEAADLSAPEDDLVPDAPAADDEAPEAAAVRAPLPPPAAPAVLVPHLDGLNFRMIQYARQAAQLVQGRTADFGVIYAPNWPAWLAALEIRNSSGRPLVLYLASLATDLPNPAEHGYQLEMERMAMRRARLVLVPDDALHHRLLALYADATGKVRVVAATDDAAVQRVLGEVAVD
ncbi:glycosyltransferase [Hymenobacter siberiensis]|uniref:glycosyltransferase n=1 Tax=Hymenobacter siberiensis TaxID=2848396 RepID=UPI001C1E199B|nr:glycosyltransferase [Hymenobacter siberiensis]MBU6121075.1 glycosyltransferase [Hymenobacter siberiensis]